MVGHHCKGVELVVAQFPLLGEWRSLPPCRAPTGVSPRQAGVPTPQPALLSSEM